MTQIQTTPYEVRQLDLDTFRLALKGLEATEYGMTELDTHVHNPPVTVAGVTLARVVEIINGYTVTFEDGAYAVDLANANSNVLDVVNLNTVSVRANNSAGLAEGASATQIQNLYDIMTADEEANNVNFIKRHRVTKAVLLTKTYTGPPLDQTITLTE